METSGEMSKSRSSRSGRGHGVSVGEFNQSRIIGAVGRAVLCKIEGAGEREEALL